MSDVQELLEQAKLLEIGAKAASGTPEAVELRKQHAAVLLQISESESAETPLPNRGGGRHEDVAQNAVAPSTGALQPAPYRTWADDLRDRAENSASEEERNEALAKLEALQKPNTVSTTEFGVSSSISRNGESAQLQAARGYVEWGAHVFPIKRGDKEPIPRWSWRKRGLTEDELPRYFANPATACNLGIALGAASKGLIDVDLDWPESTLFADDILQDCTAFGRSGKPRSHRLAIVHGMKSKKFALPNAVAAHPKITGGEHGCCVGEIRSTGLYSVFPNGVHATEETIEFDESSAQLTEHDGDDLRRRAGLCMFLAVCARFFPPKGERHDAVLAMTGTLCRVPWIADRPDRIEFIDRLVTKAARLGGRPSRGNDEHHAAETFVKLSAGEDLWSLPKLCELLGLPETVAIKLRQWLGVARDDGRKARILLNEVDLVPMLDATESALRERQAPLFQRAGSIVLVHRLDQQQADDEAEKTGVKHAVGSPVIREVTNQQLREHLSEHVQFWRPGRDSESAPIEVDVPMPWVIVSHISARSDRWKWRPLRGVIQTPTLREDGSLLDQPGYDVATQLIYDPGDAAFPSIPLAPTRHDAETALTLLKTPYEEFPFKPDHDDAPARSASRSAALSAALTIVGRTAMRFVPLIAFNAPTIASGKTLAANIAAYIASGRDAAVMTLGWDENENEKRLSGVVLAGTPVALIDNIKRPVDGDFLNAMLTGEFVGVRVLGRTGQTEVRNCTTLLATGNALQFEGDMINRVVVATIDSGLERPEERAFKRDLNQWLPQHRPRLVSAALTILRAYVCAGRPWLDDIKPSRFPDWDRLVRGALLWLGEPDPILTQGAVAALDTVRGDLGAVIEALREHHKLGKEQIFSASEVEANTRAPGALQTALVSALPNGKITVKAISKYLKSNAGRIIAGWYIQVEHDSGAEALRFRIRPAANADVLKPRELSLL